MTAPSQHGGYRAPTHPAPVSGPGAMSKRTDGGPGQAARDLPNPDYGEQQTFRAAEAGAPMAQAPTPMSPDQMVQPVDLSGVTPLGAPTQSPDEPVTAGAASGPGPGLESLGLPAADPADVSAVQYLRNSLPTLEVMANTPMASQAFRTYVRRLRAMA